MKLLTKNTDYAVRALLVLGKTPDKFISARDIAEEQKMPYQYIRKVLQGLINEGFVESREGGFGGFKIVQVPEKIRVADIINLFQGEVRLSECMFRQQVCQNRESCVLRKKIQKIEQLVVEEFEEITIGSLLKEMGEQKRRVL